MCEQPRLWWDCAPEPSLATYVISTIISCAGSFRDSNRRTFQRRKAPRRNSVEYLAFFQSAIKAPNNLCKHSTHNLLFYRTVCYLCTTEYKMPNKTFECFKGFFFFLKKHFTNYKQQIIPKQWIPWWFATKSKQDNLSPVMRKPVLPYANNKVAVQPAHLRSLISAFVVRCLDSIIPLLAIAETSRL